MGLAVKPVESDEELRLASDLIAKQHAAEDSTVRPWLDSCGQGYPESRREHTRIALWKGELAGVVQIRSETMRLGEARLRTGGLSQVTTVPRHRRRGVSRSLLGDALAYLRRHRYHLALLFGDPNVCYPFGFVTALADYAVVVDTMEALSFERVSKIRRAKPGDITAIQKIHAANDANVACSILRTSAHLTNRWQQCVSLDVLTDERGRVGGYFFAENGDNHLRVDEVGVADPKVCRDVLAACGTLAADKSLPKIHFLLPPSHPFGQFLLQVRSTHETHVLRDGGGMLALIDTGEALESMIPEWENLLGQSVSRELRTEVTFVVDGISYRVRANRGVVDVASNGGKNKIGLRSGELTQLITGYRYLDDILASRRCVLSADARTLLATLFPKRSPHVWAFDRF